MRAYLEHPADSCAIQGRDDVEAWQLFLKIRPHDKILDVGCGPHWPPYLPDSAVGLDPLPIQSCADFTFVCGMGEYLPFKDATFDVIVSRGSIDHYLAPIQALSESRRCLVPDGRLLLAFGVISRPALIPRYFSIIQYRWRKYVKKNTPAITIPDLPTPPGAVDPYHFEHCTEQGVRVWLRAAGFQVIRRQIYKNSQVFLECKKK